MDPMNILLTIEWEQPPEAATLEDYLSFAPEGEARQLFLNHQGFIPTDLVRETISKIADRFPLYAVRFMGNPGDCEWAHHLAHGLGADRYALEYLFREEPPGMLFGANIWVTNVSTGILVRLQGEPCQSH